MGAWMRFATGVFTLGAAVALVGCGGDDSTGTGGGGSDAATSHDATGSDDGGGGQDSATGQDSASGTDSATAQDSASGGDSSTGTDAGGKAFGDMCVNNTDCASMLCEPFAMQAVHRCTKACTAATQAADCPSPPSAGTCTPNLYCRFNQ